MRKVIRILILDDDPVSLENLRLSLQPRGFEVELAFSFNGARRLIDEKEFDIAIVDLKLPYKSGIHFIEEAKKIQPRIKNILITGYSNEQSIIAAIKLGVIDIIKKPYEEAELLNSISKIIDVLNLEEENITLREKLIHENQILKRQTALKYEEDDLVIIGESPEIKRTLLKALSVSATTVNVLIFGETGTGKELIAKYIHKNSERRNKPFIPINCAELSPTLFESELFGYKKGAFTNATESKPGLFEVADKGTIFLDEISEINLELQAKLLRAVDQKKIRRIGDSELRTVDIQIISATNRSQEELISSKFAFRNDLFHRLAEVEINLVPLRERKEDIPLLIDHFKKKFEKLFMKKSKEISKELNERLTNEDWEGNIRQLSNFMKNWCLFGDNISDVEVDKWITNHHINEYSQKFIYHFENGNIEEFNKAKKWMVLKILDKYEGNKLQTAKHLGMSYQGLLKMLKSLED